MADYVKLIRKTANINERAKTQPDRVSRALGETAQNAAIIARQLCPVRTGFLRDSIFVEQDGQLRFLVGASAPYASFVEQGTIFMEPQPFIRPAMVLARTTLVDKYRT